MIGITKPYMKLKCATVQGIHRSVRSMLIKGTYRGTSMLLHSFAAAALRGMGIMYYAVSPVHAMEKIIINNEGLKKDIDYISDRKDTYPENIFPGIEKAMEKCDSEYIIKTQSLKNLYQKQTL